MKGSSLVLPGLAPPVQIQPEQQAPHFSASTTLASQFQSCRRVRQYTIRLQRQDVPGLDNELRVEFLGVKHSSSFYGDGRALIQQIPWSKENFTNAPKSYPIWGPKISLDVQCFSRPLDESHRPRGTYPSRVTQLLAKPPRPSHSANVDLNKARDFNAPGELDQSTSPSPPDFVAPGWKGRPVPNSEHRSSRRAQESTSSQRAPSPANERPGRRFETSNVVREQPLPTTSPNRKASSNFYSKENLRTIEARVESENVMTEQAVLANVYSPSQRRVQQPCQKVSGGFESRQQNIDSLNVEADRAVGTICIGGSVSQAVAVLQNRLQQGITTDSGTYVEILRTCLKQNDLLAAKQVHDCIIEGGMDKNLSVAITLLNVYIKCGKLADAREVFDQLEKKTVMTWNNMIAGYAKSNHAQLALEIFSQMRQEGVKPDEITYLSILKACANLSAIKWGKEIHECIRQEGFESDVRVGTALLHMYSKCGCIVETRQVFENLINRNIITWNAMIGALAQYGHGREAYGLFLQMRQEGFEPNTITYISILNASASVGALEWVKEVHGHASKTGLESDMRVGNALVHMYARSGSIDEARKVFERMEKRDVITWNAMIGGLAENGHGHESYGLFLQMRQEGFKPDACTVVSILNPSASAGALEWVQEVHGHASKAGLESDMRVGNALVHMYAKSGSINEARKVFEMMKKRDVVTWNVMIGGLAEHGHGQDAYGLILQMRQEGFEPNAVTYVSILNASASAGALEWVKDVHGLASRAGLESDLRVGTALVRMYAKSGSIDDARLVFERMEQRDVFAWTVMIGGLAEHGCGHEALELFRKMTADLLKPDETTFVVVLSACCHSGLVDDGHRLFASMTQDYGIEPHIGHYNCMVDLLGRAGHLEEARLFIRDMPIDPDDVTWKALLGACRTYGNVELGELAAEELFKLEPSNASAYVLLSNIYAAAGKWENVSLVRSMMQTRGARKEPGRSWIEVDKKIHEFVVGDTSHPEAKAIYNELNKLTEKLKAEGYIPDTRLVLHDISEEAKELALCSHSEKLAIAYGLMLIPQDEPICVWKNLRVCPDCHTATKLISKVTGREIIARDANRFHHFKDGICSCGDYW